MAKNIYFIDRYMRCGELPLYLIFYRNQNGRKAHCVMLCTMKNLKLLLRQRKGFKNPNHFGNVVYNGYAEKPRDELQAMLKSRYYFELPFNEESTFDAF